MITTDRLRDDVERIAADELERARAVHREAFAAGDAQCEIGVADVVDAEARIEQPDERSDRARCVVVLRLAEQERAAAFEVAQVDVVADRRADGDAARIHREHDLGFRIVPLGFAMNADVRAGADRREHRHFGEDLRIRTDAHFEILRPRAACDQCLLDAIGLGGAGNDVRQVGAEDARQRGADFLRLGRIAACLFFDHAFEQARHESDAACLDHLQVARREQPWLAAITCRLVAVDEHVIEGRDARR